MHFDIGHSIKGRTRSVQLEKGMDLVTGGSVKADSSVQDRPSSPPIPAVRSSSLPSGKENAGSIRHYRSMLDVEGPPTLGPVKTFTYDELYVDNAKPSSSQDPPALANWLPGIYLLRVFFCFYDVFVCTGG